MAHKELTPAQKYLLEAFKALSGDIDSSTLAAIILGRKTTLKSAISAAFYKSVGFSIDRYI